MQRSIAAKYATRPAARFVGPPSRARERRLGLRAAGSFQASAPRATILHGSDPGPFAGLRRGWRAIRPARPVRPAGGRLRPVVWVRWTRTFVARAGRPSGAAPAPWRS